MQRVLASLLLALVLLGAAGGARAAGTLTPVGSSQTPIAIRDHHVDVVLNNGFARTEVQQTFFNPGDRDLEAVYAFPVPKSASLSEFTIFAGEKQIDGEVVAREQAERVYREEKEAGSDAGLASRNGYQTFEFRVSPVRAGTETRIRFVYYQPLEVDTGVGRYLYPLEEGGTDEVARSFWVPNSKVEGSLSLDLELKSAWPVTDLRLPGFEKDATVSKLDEGHYKLRVERQGASLDRDFLLYYRLQDGLPGRAELLSYRPEGDGPGTFMLVVTPGLDLGPIEGGSDYVFVLDTSGSMAGKIQTLARGVGKAIGRLDPEDRFRIVSFNSRAQEVTRGWMAATPENVKRAIGQVEKLRSGGSTNLYEGMSLGLDDLDDDRATSVILVTDAVTNTGVVDPRAFHEMLKRYDVRVFGFLLGNSANWPLMRAIAQASGGFYDGVSNADDILGKLLLAESKVTHETLHDAELEVSGVKTFETTGALVGKVYRGQQLVLFGRYAEGGMATLRLKARLTGEDRVYTTRIRLPDRDEDHPELERLWALSRIEEIEDLGNAGLLDGREVEPAIRDLGVAYQLVTDHSSMLVLDDEAFQRHGIQRENRARVARENAARARRSPQPPVDRRADHEKPMFDLPSPSLGGGGAIDPLSGALALGLAGLAAAARRRGGRG